MSMFSLGGNVGVALGPVIVTPLVLAFGLRGTLFMAIPGALVALVLLSQLAYLTRFRPAREPSPGPRAPAAPTTTGPASGGSRAWSPAARSSTSGCSRSCRCTT